MLAIDGGAAEFENAGSERLIRSKVEFLLGVVAVPPPSGGAGLHAVSSDNTADGIVFLLILHEEVLADVVELVGVETRLVGAFQALAQLDIKDAKTQTAGGGTILRCLREPEPITPHFGVNTVYDRGFG